MNFKETLAMEMPKIDPFWDEQLVNQAHAAHRHAPPAVQQPVGGSGSGSTHNPYERNLNFATVAVEDGEYGFPKKKTVRDPLSHRIIEKRRRDRMNNCLADLARLLPPSSLRKGRGRIEKTEIVELAIKHLRHLQCHPCPMGDKCEFGATTESAGGTHNSSPPASCSSSSTSSGYHSSHEEQFRLGFQECLSEAMHFLVEQEGLYAGDAMCVRLVKHLNTHCDTVLRDHWGNQGKVVPGFRRAAESAADFKKASGGSSSSGYHPNGSSSGSDGNGGHDGEGTEPFALPVQNPSQQPNVDCSRHSSSVLDYEAENSCSSTPLSIETSDVLSLDGKNNCRSSSKPPIPSIICSHSSNNSRIPVNSGSPANGSNGRSSDDGSANSSTSFAHRYKFKSNIKQRFTADCQTKSDDGTCYIPSGTGKCENDGDGASDTEENREEQGSVMDEPMLQSSQAGGSEGQVIGEENEVKSNQDSSSRRGSMSQQTGGAAASKSIQQISTGGGASSSSSSSSPLDKTAFPASITNNSGAVVDLKGPLAPVTPTALDLQGQRGREVVEVKPSPEELLSAIHNLSSPGGAGSAVKNQIPLAPGGEISLGSEEKGVPAFALHEKGLFYIPLTIDKSIVTNYVNRIDTTAAPPLYPVTISVCFLLNPEKKAKFEGLHHELEVSVPNLNDKPADFSQVSTPVPLPLISTNGPGLGSPMKTSRRSHREPSNFFVGRYSHQRPSSKDSSGHHGRISSSNSSCTGFGYQLLPIHSPSSSSGGGFEVMPPGNSLPMGNPMMGNPLPMGASNPYHTNYQDRNCSASPASSINEMGRGSSAMGDRESESNSSCGRNNNGGRSSSGSSGIGGNVGRMGRKRSVTSSPSVSGSGGSMGYHSWHEKGSPNSPDFFNYHHANTHALQAMAAHGHLAVGVPTGGLSPIGQRHGQALAAFHTAEAALRDKDNCFSHDKRSKKARSIDQSMEAKQA